MIQSNLDTLSVSPTDKSNQTLIEMRLSLDGDGHDIKIEIKGTWRQGMIPTATTFQSLRDLITNYLNTYDA